MKSLEDSGADTTLRTVERALSVLETVASASEPPLTKDIARALGLNTSTAYHLINTLLGRGYLVKDRAGSLHIGSQVIPLAVAHERGSDLVQMVRPTLERLRDRTGDTTYLTLWNRHRAVLALALEGTQALRVSALNIGFSGSENRRASGKAIMASLPERALARLLDDLDPMDDIARARFHDELITIRRDGFAVDDEEYGPGILCVAAPFFAASGEVSGSVTVSCPTVRRQPFQTDIRESVLESAAAITARLAAVAKS